MSRADNKARVTAMAAKWAASARGPRAQQERTPRTEKYDPKTGRTTITDQGYRIVKGGRPRRPAAGACRPVVSANEFRKAVTLGLLAAEISEATRPRP